MRACWGYHGPVMSTELPLYRQLRDARREHRLTQSALAQQVGCRQSAISMMEQGRMDAIARETMVRIGELLGVELPAEDQPVSRPAAAGAGRYCPTYDCPSNLPYIVGGELFLMPRPHPGAGAHCRYCGELLESRCPNAECARPLSAEPGGCCSGCGTSWITVPSDEMADPAQWAAAQRARIRELSG